MACKPDLVRALRLWMTIPLPTVLPRRSSCQPGPLGRWRPCGGIRGLRPDQPRARPLFGIAPGGACRAGSVASPAVGSYPTVSPLPLRTREVSSLWRFPWGYPRRGLPGTLAFWSPDFPRSLRPAVIQPSARCRGYACGGDPSTGKRRARSAARARSVSSSRPAAHGRKRLRNADSSIPSAASG